MATCSLNAARPAALLALVCVPLASPARAEMRIDELKQAYLGCERAAVAGRMEAGAAMACSILYEELKQRAFGGDFQRLKAWSDAEACLREVTG